MPRKIRAETPRKLVVFDCETVIEASEGRGQVSIVLYDGGPLTIGSYDAPMYLDLRSVIGCNRPLPLLRDHERDRIVGQVQAKIVGNSIHASGRLVGSSADRKEIEQLAADGFEWQSQVGARPYKLQRVEAGHVVNVNGRRVTGPAYVATTWRLAEASIVTLGDPGTRVSIAASDRPSKSKRQQRTETIDFQSVVAQARLERARQLQASIETSFPKSTADELRVRLKAKAETTNAEIMEKLRRARQAREVREAEGERQRLRAMLDRAAKEGQIKRELAQVRAEIREAERQELLRLREEYEASRPIREAQRARELSDKLRAARR